MSTLPQSRRFPRLTYRQELLLTATAQGCLTSFAITHNLFFHLIPLFTPILMIGAPFLGGYTVRERVRLGPVDAAVASLAIAATNTFPFLLLLPILYWHLPLLADRRAADHIWTVMSVFTAGFVVFSLALAIAGIVTRVRWPHRIKIPAALMMAAPYKILASVELEATSTDSRRSQQQEIVADQWLPLNADTLRTSRN